MADAFAIQGFEGSFHEKAAQLFLGKNVPLLYCSNFEETISKAKDDSLAAGAVMAIENSIAGTILPNYLLLQKSDLFITGEIYLQIDQNLLSIPSATLQSIREVHSHPMALLQCQDFLQNYPWKLVATEDTALSARYVSETGSEHIAAIAGNNAANLFGLKVLVPNIQTEKNNYTRFWVLQNINSALVENADKASLHFTTDHSKGSLARVLNKIAAFDINLSKLQSTPLKGSDWKYSFHADCEFNHPENFREMLEEIKSITAEVKVYGMYKNNKPKIF